MDPRGALVISLLALLASTMACGAGAATLRPFVTIVGSSIKLSDLFAGVPAGRDRRLGDAPPPGSQFIIERPQLEAIASQFGVDWTPDPTEQTAVLARAGRTVSTGEAVSVLQKAIDLQSPFVRYRAVLADFIGTAVDRDAKLVIDGLVTDPDSSTFHASLVAFVEGCETKRLSLAGSLLRLVTLPVPVHPLAAGQTVSAGDILMADVDENRVHGEVIQRVDDAIGLVTTRAMIAGVPIGRGGLRRPDLVARAAPVMMRLYNAGIELDARGKAITAGAMGDQVQVLNPGSRAILLATVVGLNEVRVEPGSAPFLPGRDDRFDGGPGSPDTRVLSVEGYSP
jgi:flagella basal body P-ring formation protein FlgA